MIKRRYSNPILAERFSPNFEIAESISNGLGEKKIGQKIKAIVEYEVIEKTKTYTVLRIKNFFVKQSSRAF